MKNYKFLENNLIYEYLETDVSLGINPLIIGYERCAKDKGVTTIDKNLYVLKYVFKGKGTLWINKRTYKIEKDTLLFFPMENVSYEPDKNDPWEYIWVEFTGTATANALLKRCNLSAQNPVFKPQQPQAIFKIFAEIIENSIIEKKRQYYQYACSGALLKLLYHVICEQNEGVLTQNSEKSKIPAIINYIEAHYDQPDLSLQSISEEFFFSPPYLSRLFKKEVNIPISKYIIQLRLNKAKKMLQSNQFKISTISYACGYSSPYYFSLEFKRNVGMSPSKYKQRAVHIE
ncbi:MAG: helix-turn-helix domain-containing protein [Clostridiales bacterium]|nr:helix-turn-helix domain-containing protein [Clostridiales bacterium]